MSRRFGLPFFYFLFFQTGSVQFIEGKIQHQDKVLLLSERFCFSGSGSTRPNTKSARESTRPRISSAGSTRPVYFSWTEWCLFVQLLLFVGFWYTVNRCKTQIGYISYVFPFTAVVFFSDNRCDACCKSRYNY